MATEAYNCWALIASKLQAAGLEIGPHSIAEKRTTTDGHIDFVRELNALKRLQAETSAELADLFPALDDCVSKGEL